MAGEADLLFTAGALFVTFLGALLILLFALRYAKTRARRIKQARGDTAPSSDGVYNALVRTEAIARELSEKGFESPQVEALLDDARAAYGSGSSREAAEYTQEARSVLERLPQEDEHDPPEIAIEVPESKPVLGQEYPPNYLQAKFYLSLVQDALKEAPKSSPEAKEARKLLKEAYSAFESEHYSESLGLSVNARRLLEGKEIPERAVLPASPTRGECPQCQAPATPEDQFCGHCGAPLVPPRCPECGHSLALDDRFCRRCGAAVEVLQENSAPAP